MRTPFDRPCCSTVILRQGKMGCHQPRSCMATHYRTPSQSTGVHLHQSGSTRSRKQSNLPRLHKKLLSSTITRQPTTCQISHVAVQHPKTKLWDTYGVVTHIGPSRQYHVQTGRNKILIQNQRFLCRRVPASIPTHTSMQEHQLMPPRRSLCARKSVNRLIEDPAWS